MHSFLFSSKHPSNFVQQSQACVRACRCAFMPVNPEANQTQTAHLLEQAEPSIILWASTCIEGGAGPLHPATIPSGCVPHQLTDMSARSQAALGIPAKFLPVHNNPLPKEPDQHRSTHPAGVLTPEPFHPQGHTSPCKHTLHQLADLFTEWRSACAAQPPLPFCYVMYTSGSTGKPVGVCGTETG